MVGAFAQRRFRGFGGATNDGAALEIAAATPVPMAKVVEAVAWWPSFAAVLTGIVVRAVLEVAATTFVFVVPQGFADDSHVTRGASVGQGIVCASRDW